MTVTIFILASVAAILYFLYYGLFSIARGLKFLAMDKTESDLVFFGIHIDSNTKLNGSVLLVLGAMVIIVFGPVLLGYIINLLYILFN